MSGVEDSPTSKRGLSVRSRHVKLYSNAVFTGYKRGLRNQHENFALLRVEGAETRRDAMYYVGKRCIFVYKGKRKTSVPHTGGQRQNRLRAIWGRVTRTHGNSGSVRARFTHNLPPNAMGRNIRIMMYPSSI